MSVIDSKPKTLQQAIIYYANEENCLADLIAMRWRNGVCCPRCGDLDVTKLQRLFRKQTRVIWKCNGCKKQFSAKIGTPLETSPLPLTKWLPVIWMQVNAKNGISSCEVSRALGVTQKTAWFMVQRVREMISDGNSEKFDQPVEADESYIGGKEENKHEDKKLHAGRGGVGKTIVMGILQRTTETSLSKVRANIVPSRTRKVLQSEIKKHVHDFTKVYTDAWTGYQGLTEKYLHEFVDHAIDYAIGQVHTNGIENFWSLLKRCLKGTYISVEPFHLKRYIDEMAFRFNNRGGTDRDRFMLALSMMNGKRLTYAALTEAGLKYYREMGNSV